MTPTNTQGSEQELLIELQNFEVQGVPLKNMMSGERMKDLLALIKSDREANPKFRIVQISPVMNDRMNYMFGLSSDGRPYYWDIMRRSWVLWDGNRKAQISRRELAEAAQLSKEDSNHA